MKQHAHVRRPAFVPHFSQRWLFVRGWAYWIGTGFIILGSQFRKPYALPLTGQLDQFLFVGTGLALCAVALAPESKVRRLAAISAVCFSAGLRGLSFALAADLPSNQRIVGVTVWTMVGFALTVIALLTARIPGRTR